MNCFRTGTVVIFTFKSPKASTVDDTHIVVKSKWLVTNLDSAIH